MDGELVHTVSGKAIIDPNGFTGSMRLNKAMDVIIDVEEQNWRSDKGLTPTDAELAYADKKQYLIDWIRFYKPASKHTSKKYGRFNNIPNHP